MRVGIWVLERKSLAALFCCLDALLLATRNGNVIGDGFGRWMDGDTDNEGDWRLHCVESNVSSR